MTQQFQERYVRLLRNYLLNPGEVYLEEAYRLGKELVTAGYDVEEIGEMHTLAIERLAQEFPESTIDEERGHVPLLEVLVAYGMAFKAQAEWLGDQKDALEREVAERVRAEQELRKSEARWRSLVTNAPDIIFTVDCEGRILFINHAPAGLTAEEAVGTNALDYVAPEYQETVRQSIQRVFQTGEPDSYEIAARGPYDVTSWYSTVLGPIRDNDNVVAVMLITRDITERKQAEEALLEYSDRLEDMVEARTQALRDAQEQLVRHERLAVLGQLAGGVAHELRNPLGVITNATYYLKLVQPDAGETVREYLDLIESEIHGATQIITDLLDFARAKVVDREPAPVAEMVGHVLAQQPPPEDVTVTTDIPPDLPPAFVDPHQIEQVLVNLVVNAYQAMPDGGRLVVRAEREGDTETRGGGDKEKGSVSPGHPLTPSPCLCVSVSDTGSGISPEHMDKLFEPLFTTKARGIGLGLATSRNLVEANGGHIEVESQVGKGSTFTVWLSAKESVS